MADETTGNLLSPRGHPLRVLLVDDQAIVGESVRRMLADEEDIEFHYCTDATRAISEANRLRPTVILQDLVMPDVDGLLLVKFYRANPATQETPLVVLSSKEEPVIKAKAFALGANDYLVKLPDKLEMVARLRYHSQAYLSRLERDEAFRQLAESQRHLTDELRQAARYVQSLLPAPQQDGIQVNWRFIPSAHLGGDMFGYHWIDSHHFAVYLLDVSGHGVGPSLLAVSAANLLASQALPGTDFRHPGEVIARLNDIFQMEKQNGKYFTIFYAVYRHPDRSLAYCNAAHPAALLLHGPSSEALELVQLESTDPFVGMLPPASPFETQTITLQDHARLLIYSDGAFEIEQASGEMWTYEEFVERVRGWSTADDLMERLTQQARQLRGSDNFNDDFSLMHLCFPNSVTTKSPERTP